MFPAERPEQEAVPARGPLRAAAGFLFSAVLFGLIYTQAPLYYSNQNQYFLHGLARGGAGWLRDDWLANTADPTPLFTQLVAGTYRFLPEATFYVYYVLLLGIYLQGLVWLFALVAGRAIDLRLRLIFVPAVLLIHSALFRLLCSWGAGQDYLWYFQAGVAGQYLLGPTLQPSAFGVLLLVSIPLFLRGQPFLATVCAATGAIVHSTYLLGAGILTLSYMTLLVWDKRGKHAVLLGAFALVLVAPMVIVQLRTFGPTSASAFAQAQDILVHFRIPHHAVVRDWLNPLAVAQLAWIVAAIVLVHGSRLGWILLVSLVVSVLLTLVQLATDNNTLALLFPWRTSVYLVPTATAIILARLLRAAASKLEAWTHRPLGKVLPIVVIGGLAGSGLVIQYTGWGYRHYSEEVPLLSYVREHKARDDVYLLPIEPPPRPLVNTPPTSAHFPATPPPGAIGPIDLQKFRLATGAPIFVDFKAIPYRDIEVLQWRQRLEWNYQCTAAIRDRKLSGLARALAERGITHVVTRAAWTLPRSEFQLRYEDGYFRIYRLTKQQ